MKYKVPTVMTYTEWGYRYYKATDEFLKGKRVYDEARPNSI